MRKAKSIRAKAKGPMGRLRDRAMQIRLTEAEYSALVRAADRQDVTLSNLVRKALKPVISRRTAEKHPDLFE